MRKVEVTLSIHANPERIIDAFVDPEKLQEWWQVERALIEPRKDGVFMLASDN